ncbi:MAG: GWxTD domain-containing protein [Bacteroidota bacterium]|nr:GWxTD domain-containing protein [Bacteroidota bacterium]
MKKTLLLILMITASLAMQAQEKSLGAQFHYAKFLSPGDGPYLETYLTVMGNSAVFKKNENGKMQASVSVTFMFKQEGELIDFRKFNLLSPELLSDSSFRPNFIDVQRIPLPKGLYEFELILKDKHTDVKPFTISNDLDLDFMEDSIEFSGIQLIEKYYPTEKENILSKNGFDMLPYVSNFYPENAGEIIFYTEMYNTNRQLGTAEPFLLKYYIESFETTKIMHEFTAFKREKAKDVIILLGKFNIKELPSGNYNLVFEIRNSKNEMIKNKHFFFQRSNPKVLFAMNDLAAIDVQSTFASSINNIDTLADYVKSLYPISNINERRFANNILKYPELEKMQQYFVNFWSVRNQVFPEKEWEKYKKRVKMVNLAYTTQIDKGFETDRGRIFLQYGTPNSIHEEKYCSNCYPFEIWQYYELNGQMNRKILFYNRQVVGDDYRLLHSNIKGEFYNNKWLQALHHEEEASRQIGNTYNESDNDIQISSSFGCQPKAIWDNP